MKKGLLFLIQALFLFSCAPQNPSTTSNKNTIQIHSIPEVVELHDEYQKGYILDNDVNSIDNYGAGSNERSKPKELELSWEQENDNHTYQFHLALDETFQGESIFDVKEEKITLDNLFVGTKYYYYVSSSTGSSAISSFQTCDETPRFIDVGGVTNIRDLGGYQIGEKRTKQGLLYRGGRLNYSLKNVKEPTKQITEEGEKVFKEQLKIKTEIDLRGLSDNGYGDELYSVVEGVNYVSCPCEYGSGSHFVIEDNYPSYVKCLETIADKNNYPIYFHCSIGTDRTGFISYLINGLLGVQQNLLYKDYLFSNLGQIGKPRVLDNLKEEYGDTIDALEGKNLSQKIEAFMLQIGVKQSTIDSLKTILY